MLPKSRKIKFINKKKIVKIILNKNIKVYITYVIFINPKFKYIQLKKV